ncbi:hypothetical protein SDC9_194123 [bioreactor metagenome]|uniref:Uncharacterized protein n=1 Tax=bioreactor metagenome TaxID=1076179 RepID=A0A645IE19_9ZZZZ
MTFLIRRAPKIIPIGKEASIMPKALVLNFNTLFII